MRPRAGPSTPANLQQPESMPQHRHQEPGPWAMAQRQRMPRFLTHCFLPPLLSSFQEVPNLKTLNQRPSWQGHVDPGSRVLQSREGTRRRSIIPHFGRGTLGEQAGKSAAVKAGRRDGKDGCLAQLNYLRVRESGNQEAPRIITGPPATPWERSTKAPDPGSKSLPRSPISTLCHPKNPAP